MTMKLADRINEIVMKEGHQGKSRLSLAAGVSVPTVEKVRKGEHIPKPQTAYKLAVAAGFSEAEAKDIGKSCFAVARESA